MLASYLRIQKTVPNWDIVFLNTPLIRERFRQSMGELQKELFPQYIDYDSLYSKLWELFREVVLSKSKYQASENLTRRVSDFASEIKRELKPFEVLYEIRYLNIGKKRIKVGDIEIFELEEEYLKNLGFEQKLQEMIIETWTGKLVAKINVTAAQIQNAIDTGRPVIEEMLQLLRVAVRKESLSDHRFFFYGKLDHA